MWGGGSADAHLARQMELVKWEMILFRRRRHFANHPSARLPQRVALTSAIIPSGSSDRFGVAALPSTVRSLIVSQ